MQKISCVIKTSILAFFAFSVQASNVNTEGGLMIGSKDDPYWFKLGGIIKLDQRVFWGDTSVTPAGNKYGTYTSSGNLRDLGLNLDGGVGENFTYKLGFNFNANSKQVGIDDAYVTYNGWKDLMPNFSVSFGQINPGFCLESATSSKWTPFMERSMPTNVFGPCPGLGVSAGSFNNSYSLTVAASQPKAGTVIKSPTGATINDKHDRWQLSTRLTYAPIAEKDRIVQVGLSGHIQEHSNTGLEFSATPEVKARNVNSLLNTSTITGTRIAAKNQTTIDIELSVLYGPWSGEVEYQKANIKRGKLANGTIQGNNLSFNGYHAQISYVLTGESRPHNKATGTFGQIKPNSKNGAWEVSLRYSYINLNSEDINGGSAHNTSGSISWYANNNIRVIGEYVHSEQQREFTTYIDDRILNSIGMRLQVVF